MKFKLLLLATLTSSHVWAQIENSSCQILKQQMSEVVEKQISSQEEQTLQLLKEIVPDLDQQKLSQLRGSLDTISKKFSPSLSLDEEKVFEKLQLRHSQPKSPEGRIISEMAGGPLNEKEKEQLKSFEIKQQKYEAYREELSRAEKAIDEYFAHSIHGNLKLIDRASPGDKYGRVFVNGVEYQYDRKSPSEGNILTTRDSQGKEQRVIFRLLGNEISVSHFPQKQNETLNKTLLKLANDSGLRTDDGARITDVALSPKGIKQIPGRSEVKYDFIGSHQFPSGKASHLTFDSVTSSELIEKLLPEKCREKAPKKTEHISDTARESIKDTQEGGFLKRLFGAGSSSKQ